MPRKQHQQPKAIAKPTNQPARGVRGVRTMRADLVGDRLEGVPRPMTGGSAPAGGAAGSAPTPAIGPVRACPPPSPGSGCAPRQVGRARLGVQLGRAGRSCARRALERDAALRVVDVAEDDRLRSGRPAGRRSRPRRRGSAVLVWRPRCAPGDALHAVGALLHDAAAAHRHVGVAHQLQALGRRRPVRRTGGS
jgi:hypothetical protein